jgi:Ca-activated chloride channel family protein
MPTPLPALVESGAKPQPVATLAVQGSSPSSSAPAAGESPPAPTSANTLYYRYRKPPQSNVSTSGLAGVPWQTEAQVEQLAEREVARRGFAQDLEEDKKMDAFYARSVEGEKAKATKPDANNPVVVTSNDTLQKRADIFRRQLNALDPQSNAYRLQLERLNNVLEDIRNPRSPKPPVPVRPESTNESYLPIIDNPFKAVTQEPLSTFSIDVDTGAYTNARRFISRSQLPPRDSVRIEEMVNYFKYNYAAPVGDEAAPFATNVEVASAPWDTRHRLVRVGIKGHEMHIDERPSSNLVFLMDVSGSMSSQDKLPLLKKSMKMLVDKLSENDRVAIVVYAGASGLVLDSTTASNKALILESLDRLSAGGSTNGGDGIRLAYSIATQNFIEGGVNRVILATDGDFNVGTTSHNDLMSLIERKRKSDVFLSVLGFGTGNLKDSTMEQLANKGNGSYHYIDRLSEGRRVLVEQATGTLVTIAKDVKIQIEFNPSIVQSYRLIGYENRVMAAKDFNDDTKDAGEIGAGHTVTALYEVVPTVQAAAKLELPAPDRPANVDPLKYQQPAAAPEPIVQRELTDAATSGEMLTVKLRYKLPDEDVSTKLEVPVVDEGVSFEAASDDFRFASSVAGFGMILRQSPYRGDTTLGQVIEWAEGSMGQDAGGYRREFIDLVNKVDEMR